MPPAFHSARAERRGKQIRFSKRPSPVDFCVKKIFRKKIEFSARSVIDCIQPVTDDFTAVPRAPLSERENAVGTRSRIRTGAGLNFYLCASS